MPIAFDIASTKGSQFFFWFTEASVEMTPKVSSVGASARATEKVAASAIAAYAIVFTVFMTLPPSGLRALMRGARQNYFSRVQSARGVGALALERQCHQLDWQRRPAVRGLCVICSTRRNGGAEVERGEQVGSLGAVDLAEKLRRQRKRR